MRVAEDKKKIHALLVISLTVKTATFFVTCVPGYSVTHGIKVRSLRLVVDLTRRRDFYLVEPSS